MRQNSSFSQGQVICLVTELIIFTTNLIWCWWERWMFDGRYEEHVVLSALSLWGFLSKSRSFTGKAEAGGRMHVTLCDYIMLWDSLSATQKKSLSQRYQMGCDCKVRQFICMVHPWEEGTVAVPSRLLSLSNLLPTTYRIWFSVDFDNSLLLVQ